MAAGSADPVVTTATCANCHREIPSPNIELHSAHCARNLQKCEHCGDMIPRKLMDEHYNENHAPVICSLCQQTVERELWDLHKGLQCPQRMLACQYCEFELPAADIFEHQDVCGNRTEYCQPCRKYIRLRELIGHEIQFHSHPNVASESSSDRSTLEEESYPAEEQPARPKPPQGLHCKQLIITIAVAGIAILIGSILLKKNGWLL
ncbi:XIAP-associated factor 1-like [Oryza brachyantha]|uniref:TRAFD1/XAF1 zinc finger domain-containing protein n=1 Tax=Oryza brachyantha TaxID=4533 RepID=J3MNP4_ORYBR|nr:XIAP-associated factor 1-like [Oryza brachyantha]